MADVALKLAALLVEHVQASQVVDVEWLAADPVAAIAADDSVVVDFVDPGSLPRSCSIVATYDASSIPPRICVPDGPWTGHRNFSVLHEYAHHLRNQVPGVLEILFSAGLRAGSIEESMCDIFASRTLIPDDLRAELFADGVSAGAVARLIASSSASSWAACVSASQSLEHPGYVMLLDGDAQTLFAGRAMDMFPVSRGARQTGLLARAARGLALRGSDTVVLGGGSFTQELNIETAVVPSGIVAVAVDGPVPWKNLYAGRDHRSSVEENSCSHCAFTYPTLGASCRTCDVVPCPQCSRCDCVSQPMRGERQCTRCFVLKPPRDFESDLETVCVECG
jgi:hypothetical protein